MAKLAILVEPVAYVWGQDGRDPPRRVAVSQVLKEARSLVVYEESTLIQSRKCFACDGSSLWAPTRAFIWQILSKICFGPANYEDRGPTYDSRLE